jgi:hypothetical protein
MRRTSILLAGALLAAAPTRVVAQSGAGSEQTEQTEQTAPTERPGPEAPSGPAPVLVVPLPGEDVPAERGEAIGDAALAEVRGALQRRPAELAPQKTVAAIAGCREEDETAGEGNRSCIGKELGEAAAGVLVHMQPGDGGTTVRLEVLSAGSGEPRGEALELELGPDADPAEALQSKRDALAGQLPAPPPQSTLLLAANVDDAKVTVDGQDQGETPMAPLELQPGKHTVRVEAGGFRPFEQQVRVAPGEAARLNADLRPDASTQKLIRTQEQERSTPPLYRRWELWAGVGGAVAAGVIIGAAVAAAGGGQGDPDGFPVPELQR